MPPIPDPTSRCITVMGLGRFGGGVGVTRYLASRSAKIIVSDRDGPDQLADSIAQIQPLIDQGSVTLHLGGHTVDDFTDADLIVASPAVPKPWANEHLNAARKAGVPITTEIGLLVERLGNPSRYVGVTGSAGKSTTASMIAHALRSFHRVHLGGNIGGSLLDSIDVIAADDFVVLELSSAMLCWLRETGWSPGVAAVTNLTENHLDWHGDMAHYEQSKRAITDNQHANDIAILPPELSHWSDRAHIVQATEQSKDLAGVRLNLPGAHNRLNAQFAAHAASALLKRSRINASPNECAQTLQSFKALPHRLEFVIETESLRAYNDSKSTTPESTLRAVEALLEDGGAHPSPIHLICGGSDKGADFAPLVEAARQCARVYTIGLTGPTIADAIGVGTVECCDLETAIRESILNATPGSVILLSPACASFDQFESYVERGEVFSRLIREKIANRSKTEKISK